MFLPERNMLSHSLIKRIIKSFDINFKCRDLLDTNPMLVVATTGALFQINAKTLELCKYIDLQGR